MVLLAEAPPALRTVLHVGCGAPDVTFRYPCAAPPALDGISFSVEAGQVIGAVGRSGSGTTTVTRLIQGIHAPQSGLIRFGDADIRTIELDHLRRHVGVLLQENLLFRGTLRENIAAARPTPRWPRCWRPRASPGRRNSSSACPWPTTPWLRKGRATSPAASASASPSPAPR